MQAMAARLKTGHRDPQIPNEARATTGNEIWYIAPMRPVKQMKVAEIVYPTQTQSQHCHQESDVVGVPPAIMALAIIHVLMLKLSAIQKPTKFQGPHCLRSGSTTTTSAELLLRWKRVLEGTHQASNRS